MARSTSTQFFFVLLCLWTAEGFAGEAAVACRQLESVLRNVTFLPWRTDYSSLSTENWSQTAWAEPSCIVQPVDTQEVKQVVQTLTDHDVYFAIRSGGHSPSPLAANINNGVLIDLSMFNQVHYDAANHVAIIGTGAKWDYVYSQLDAYNVTVVGGRVPDVGVGGLILGGGLSYLSDLYGLACDNVVNFEIVLANGSILNANAECNQDLFRALKGGSNNFGIVTRFTLSTYAIHQVWGGIRSYAFEQLPALLSAMLEYQSVPDKDPYANLIMQCFLTNSSIGAVLSMVYLKPEASPRAFSPFYRVPAIADTTKIQSFTDVINGQTMPTIPRWDWFATSHKPSASLYEEVKAIVTGAPELEEIKSLTSGTMALGIQPISSSVVHAGNARGGNSLGLDSVNQTWFVLATAWSSSDGDEIAHNATRAIIESVEHAAKTDGTYLPYMFMNDASWDQDVMAHYGAKNLDRLREAQRKYDPELLFQRLASGGFKLP